VFQIPSQFILFRSDIPYSLYFRSNTQVCLIVRDPQDKWKELIHKAWKDDGMRGLSLPKVRGL
jgi:hypothetical protein